MWRLFGIALFAGGLWLSLPALLGRDDDGQAPIAATPSLSSDVVTGAYLPEPPASAIREAALVVTSGAVPSAVVETAAITPVALTARTVETSQGWAETVVPEGQARGELVASLQREFTRVGCYVGKAHGVWNKKTRGAAKRFVAKLSAQIPAGEPSYVLLTLVEKYDNRACGEACPIGSSPDARGICTPRDEIAALIEQAPVASPEPPVKRAADTVVATGEVVPAAIPLPSRKLVTTVAAAVEAQPAVTVVSELAPPVFVTTSTAATTAVTRITTLDAGASPTTIEVATDAAAANPAKARKAKLAARKAPKSWVRYSLGGPAIFVAPRPAKLVRAKARRSAFRARYLDRYEERTGSGRK